MVPRRAGGAQALQSRAAFPDSHRDCGAAAVTELLLLLSRAAGSQQFSRRGQQLW